METTLAMLVIAIMASSSAKLPKVSCSIENETDLIRLTIEAKALKCRQYDRVNAHLYDDFVLLGKPAGLVSREAQSAGMPASLTTLAQRPMSALMIAANLQGATLLAEQQ